jgi:cation diffusion facilitator CzcD-associated flavoprotein CzcO
MSEALLDQMMMASQRELPQSTVDIAVVGAGLTGISVSTHFASAGVDLVLLEKTFTVGGVW